MKNRLILLNMTLIVLTLCTCHDRNEPIFDGGGVDNGGGTQNVSVDFKYEITQPFTVSFTNLSSGVNSYKWDFGDGETSDKKNVTHVYASAGSYTITLTGVANGVKYDCRKKVAIKNPSIYIAGYKLYKIPYENRYYKVVCKDDDWFTTNWGFTTAYTPLLDNSDMPYIKYFQSPQKMTNLDGDNYYTFYVYYTKNNSNTNGDTQCLNEKLTKTAIYQYKDEHILTSDNGKTKIGILMKCE